MNDNIETTPVSLKPSLLQQLSKLAKGVRPYLWPALIVLFVLLYGYLLLRINGFGQAKPTPLQVSSDYKATATPAINPSVVNQLNQLQNTSVSVQALFNQARSNPFQ